MNETLKDRIISANNISKSIQNFDILKNLNLTVNRSDFLIIVGESGCGKSTLLSILGGLDFADSGTLLVGDWNLTEKISEKDLLEYRTKMTGFIYQDFNLIPTLTVIENILLVSELTGTVVDPTRLDDIIRRFQLERHIAKYPENLSGGEMQRTAIARSILLKPPILYADEPTGNLDAKNADEVIGLIKELNQDGHTILLVTHSKKVAKSGNSIHEMVNGQFLST
jgi:putative ABC transport system ATP-binding protein